MSYVQLTDYKSEILSKVSEEDLFKQYVISNFEIGKLFSSPFRQDRTPSAVIFKFNNRLYFKDFGDNTYKGDIFSILSKYWNMSFSETLKKIYYDLKLYDKDKKIAYRVEKKAYDSDENTISKSVITTEIRKWYLRDKIYWETNYQISLKELQDNDIYPLKSFTVTNEKGSWTFDVNDSFAYGLKNENEWKIYQPLSDNKWTSNIPNSRLEWFDKSGDSNILIITKSRKDKIILDRLIDCHKIVVQNEKVELSEKDIEYIRHKYELIIIIYDNDQTGISQSKELEQKLMFPNFKNVYNLSDQLEFNDTGEYAKNKSTIRLKTMIDEIVSNFDFLPF